MSVTGQEKRKSTVKSKWKDHPISIEIRRLKTSGQTIDWQQKDGKVRAVEVVFVEPEKSKQTEVRPLTDWMNEDELVTWLKAR